MPDITMCDNMECPLRGECYRYLAVPKNRQSWGHFEPRDGDCTMRIAVGNKANVRTVERADEENKR